MFVLCFSLFVPFAAVVAGLTVEVRTNEGYVEGLIQFTKKGTKYAGFRGIRYAAPPLSQYRLKDPQQLEPWTGVKNAFEDGKECLQWSPRMNNVTGSEDCLFLNVYTPQVPVSEPDVRLPVMVWIHGGGWSSGAGTSNYYAPDYLVDHNVVLVTVNYRLGPLGFLSTGDLVSPGNYGLKDQVAALRWVHQNIAYFGGNDKKVTIFGQEAGGASVHYHLLSPLSQGLFHGAISHSGTALCPWASSQKPVFYAKKLGSLVSCPSTSTAELLKCLRGKDGKSIIAADRQLLEWNAAESTAFKPVVEVEWNGAFLSEDPLEILHDGDIEISVPWIAGITSHEGGNRAEAIHNSEKLLRDISEEFERVAPLSLYYGETSAHAELVTKKLKEYYFHNLPVASNTVSALADMYTDGLFLWNIDESIRLHSLINSEPIYYYVFSYRGSTSFCGHSGKTSLHFGACHGDELQYLFPLDGAFKNENDNKMMEIMTKLWTDFASSGNPNADKRFGSNWENVASHEIEYFNISLQPSAGFGLFHERMQFWTSLPIRGQNTHSYTFRDEL